MKTEKIRTKGKDTRLSGSVGMEIRRIDMILLERWKLETSCRNNDLLYVSMFGRPISPPLLSVWTRYCLIA